MSPPWVRPSLRGLSAYAPPKRDRAGELLLDLNEGAPLAPDGWFCAVASKISPDSLRRYPDAAGLEARLAGRLGLEPRSVLVTNGGDDAIDRMCRACLNPGDEIIVPSPSFEMIARSAELMGGRVVRTPWMGGAFPIDAVINAATDRTRVIAVVSPNNPTGGVITAEGLRTLSAALPNALLMVDLAYTEFADADLTAAALSLPNAVVVRTFSKAYGLASYPDAHRGAITTMCAFGSSRASAPASTVTCPFSGSTERSQGRSFSSPSCARRRSWRRLRAGTATSSIAWWKASQSSGR